jgi:DNA-directed RNA polymerase subunit L
MEVKIVEENKNKFVFEVKGVSHGFCMMLKEKLLEDDHVKIATYRVDHPLVNTPRFLVETDGADPKNAVLNAIKKLKTIAEKAQKDFKDELK